MFPAGRAAALRFGVKRLFENNWEGDPPYEPKKLRPLFL